MIPDPNTINEPRTDNAIFAVSPVFGKTFIFPSKPLTVTVPSFWTSDPIYLASTFFVVPIFKNHLTINYFLGSVCFNKPIESIVNKLNNQPIE